MARVTKRMHGKISSARSIHRRPNFVFHFFCPTSVSILWWLCVHMRISDCVEIVCELPLLLNNTASETFFTLIGRHAKCWLDIYCWGASLAVSGRARDRQNVLQSFCQTGSVAAQIFFFIVFLETYVRNITITLWINCTIIFMICISDSNAVIINNLEDSKTLFCSSKLMWARRRISFEICKLLGTGYQKVCQPCFRCLNVCRLQLECDGTRWYTGGEVKGKLANEMGSQYSSRCLGTWCIHHYYRWWAHLGCQ